MSNLAIIPARGGSKRIPRKNIKEFLGLPIISYSIKAAVECGLFDEIVVSTDDEEIAEIATKYGATVPFFRSEINSSDFAGTEEVLLEVISQMEAKGRHFNRGCCIYPTAPLILTNHLSDAFKLLINKNFDTVFPVVKYSYPILRSLIIDGEQKVIMKWPEYLNFRSQDLPDFFHDAGQFYWFDLDSFKKEKCLFSQNSGVIVLDEKYVQDIDNFSDWSLAESKYKEYILGKFW